MCSLQLGQRTGKLKIEITDLLSQKRAPGTVIPGRRAAANPEPIFQRPVFLDSGFAPSGRAPE
jgi:hypothetical protein